MASVTQLARTYKQPYGGYLPVRTFTKKQFDDGIELSTNENILPQLVGLAVDYLTRLCQNQSFETAFSVSLRGIDNYKAITHQSVDSSMMEINGLDDKSIINACRLASFDVWYRNLAAARTFKDPALIQPNAETINNIKTMVTRTLTFFDNYEPIVENGFTMPGGYTATVDSGDGDYLTTHTLVDLKVSKQNINSKYTLQLAMYYLMGMHSINPNFENIETLAIFNPRLNKLYSRTIADIEHDVLTSIASDVIVY
ncbi:hypothetical protein [Apilactobacillus xinyiensis]|uniref:PD-(D/E)XK endonuclease-like domain-containing protein n=1 Tax=Apilactobacillus xinyiensis TaxID=2841032 RepID=A0ABT0I2B6_9LACO|nr:hypothetical protein [Apilactobacillus xinyiensis]MCK8624846.1 hypothetical protein [Apilactobacillus xinyiensis]MCL0319236.1 hypothetical protein [Apilactobacillus xinyiensis]